MSTEGKSERAGTAPPVFIGLTTGNWVFLPADDIAVPRLLARGEGHGAFKAELLKQCDETFVVAPLGKVVLAPKREDDMVRLLKTFNEMLGYSSKSDDQERKGYEIVKPPTRSKTIKLVTTSRTEKSILLNHSALVGHRLGDPLILTVDDDTVIAKSRAAIAQLNHFTFPFDNYSGKPVGEQMQAEIPHEETRTPNFMSKFLDVKLQ